MKLSLPLSLWRLPRRLCVDIFGKAFTGSALPAGHVASQYKLIQQMEAITSQYRNEITNNTSFSLATFKSNYVDGKQYVDSAKTGLVTLPSSDATYTTATCPQSDLNRWKTNIDEHIYRVGAYENVKK